MKEILYQYNPWWEGKKENTGYPRSRALAQFDNMLRREQIEVIMGSRRIGKTTFLKQLIEQELQRGFDARHILYLSLDNPAFSGITIQHHIEQYRKMFSLERDEKILLALDEVQECNRWEKELKALYDMEKIKILISGSTSTLLTTPGSALTGRQNVFQLFPLDFEEYLRFNSRSVTRSEPYLMENLVDGFIKAGGYPENVLNPSLIYLANLLNDIMIRDIAMLFNTRRTDIIKGILRSAAQSVGSRTSYHRVAKVLGINLETVKKYFNYCEQSFLLKPLEKWSTSINDRIYSYRKFYFYDTGFLSLLSEQPNRGARAENMIFLELMRRGLDNISYFFEGEKEIDFITGTYSEPVPVESKYTSAFDWDDRMWSKLKAFIDRYRCRRCFIVTESVNKAFRHNTAEITVLPLWDFLLGENFQ